MRSYIKLIPGVLLCSILAVFAFLINKYVSLSASLIAIILGFAAANLLPFTAEKTQPGLKWCESKALAIAVAFLGAQLNMVALKEMNAKSLSLVVITLVITFVTTLYMAKAFRVSNKEACLLASGQGICGSAAVMAGQSIIKAPGAQVGLVIALVNFLGFVGVFVTVWMSNTFFHDDYSSAGVLMGNTLQSMGHVVAAGFSTDAETAHLAVLIKMCRILLLIPVLLLMIYFKGQAGKKQDALKTTHWLSLVPLFIWVFLLLSILATLGYLPALVVESLAKISHWLFLLALVAIGLGIKIQHIFKRGGHLLLLGVVVFCVQLGFTAIWLVYI